jgi:hypothetical protein
MLISRLFVAWFALAFTLRAQQLGGRLEGVVSDPQGAVVPGARVVATHQETNTTYRATTSDTGVFVIPNVRLGRYTITVDAAGFRQAIVRDVLVEVGSTATVAITLQVGALQEAVTVTAEGAQAVINTVDAELSTVVDMRRVL